MLSQIERNEANPTVAILWRLASALGTNIAELLQVDSGDGASPLVVTPLHETPTIKSQDGKCELRILSPAHLAGTVEWYHLTIAIGGVLASQAHERGTKEHLTVQAGSVLVRSGPSEALVRAGDTARYSADVQHSLSNQGKSTCSALLVVEYSR